MNKNKAYGRYVFRFFLILLAALTLGTAAAESYEASTMRLLRYSGAVRIEDASGKLRYIMRNARFNSGETMRTAEKSDASLGLDDSKIVTLDAKTRVTFRQQDRRLKMTLLEGALFLDVQKKLDENETLDIETSTMAVGIRGTIVYVSDRADADQRHTAELYVLEGTARLSYVDGDGAHRLVAVPAGQKATMRTGDAAPAIAPLTAEDLKGFIEKQIKRDPALQERTAGAVGAEIADVDWNAPVTLVAQSASKVYDGRPLSRLGDVLVEGLPAEFSIRVSASGSRTEAGESLNIIEKYAIYNAAGEDVTGRFTKITTVDGILRVDPAPLTIWTGSAAKMYDGEPLTNEEARLLTYIPEPQEQPSWRNAALVSRDAAGGEILYGLCGASLVHGTNPVTGEIREYTLQTGQQLSVYLSDQNAESLVFRIDMLKESALPEEMLRLYADNPDLMTQACEDAGWNPRTLAGQIRKLPKITAAKVEQAGLNIAEDASERLLLNCIDARITVDTEITNYNSYALEGSEACFTQILPVESIRVTAVGSQTEIGRSVNAYVIEWGDAHPGSYAVTEKLGTLKVQDPVYDAPIYLTAGYARKTYDGVALERSSVEVEGLPEGFTIVARASGQRTNAGTSPNKVSFYEIRNAEGEDVTDRFTNVILIENTLRVDPRSVRVTTGSGRKYYDGRPLTNHSATISGLVGSDANRVSVRATGSITNPGSVSNGYAINWGGVNSGNYTVSANLGTLTVLLSLLPNNWP